GQAAHSPPVVKTRVGSTTYGFGRARQSCPGSRRPRLTNLPAYPKRKSARDHRRSRMLTDHERVRIDDAGRRLRHNVRCLHRPSRFVGETMEQAKRTAWANVGSSAYAMREIARKLAANYDPAFSKSIVTFVGA